MAKLVACLAVLLSFGAAPLRSMSLEDRAEDFGEDLPDDAALPGRAWAWEPSTVAAGDKRSRFLEAEAEEGPPEPEIDTESLLRAALAMRREAAEEGKQRKAPSHMRDVTPDELREVLGEAPRRKKAPAKRDSLLRQYLASALEKKAEPERRKRVVKRGAVRAEADDAEADDAESGGEAEADQPRDNLLRRLLVANALLNAENGYLTEALNEATIAQTTGNDAPVLKREMMGIENAEQIEAVLEQLKRQEKKQEEAVKANKPERYDETVVVTDNTIANLDACPVVKELSTGCRSVIEDYRFSMDQDAIDACDAHSVCYGCSSATRSTSELCDQIFLAQSKNLCAQELDRDQCLTEAGTLLRAMQREHQAVYSTSPRRDRLCSNPCVDAFFSAVYRPRR